MKHNILLLDGHTRQVLPMAKWLRVNGHQVTVLCPGIGSLAYYSRWPHKKIFSPCAEKNPEAFKTFLLELLRKKHFDLVIPLFDHSAEVLSRHKDLFQPYAVVAVNDWEVFRKARYKRETMRICEENNIPHAKTLHDLEAGYIEQVSGNLSFPVVVKPSAGDSAKGVTIVNNMDQLPQVYQRTVEEFGSVVVQEYIPNHDIKYQAELFISQEGKMVAGIVYKDIRWYPLTGGSSTLCVTVHKPEILRDCEKLLKSMDWVGYAHIDLIEDYRDGISKVIEINPRINGAVMISFKAGLDFAKIITDFYLENKEPVEIPVYIQGLYLRHFHKDILWLLKSSKRFNTQPSWFSFKNNVDKIIDRKDLLPAFVYTFTSFTQFVKDSFAQSTKN